MISDKLQLYTWMTDRNISKTETWKLSEYSIWSNVLQYNGIWDMVAQGKRAFDFFLPYNKKRQDLHLLLHNKYFSEKTSSNHLWWLIIPAPTFNIYLYCCGGSVEVPYFMRLMQHFTPSEYNGTNFGCGNSFWYCLFKWLMMRSWVLEQWWDNWMWEIYVLWIEFTLSKLYNIWNLSDLYLICHSCNI